MATKKTAKKAPAKKAVAKKTATKKAPAKKAAAKKTAAKKAPAKKVVAKKLPPQVAKAANAAQKTVTSKKKELTKAAKTAQKTVATKAAQLRASASAARAPVAMTAKAAVTRTTATVTQAVSKTALTIEKLLEKKQLPKALENFFTVTCTAKPSQANIEKAINAMSATLQAQVVEAFPWCSDDGESMINVLLKENTDGVKELAAQLHESKLEAAKIKNPGALLLTCCQRCLDLFCKICIILRDHVKNCCAGLWPCKPCCYCRDCCCGTVRVRINRFQTMCARILAFKNATVDCSGSTAVIAMQGEQGDKGDKGDKGDPGEPGEPGVSYSGAENGDFIEWNGGSWHVCHKKATAVCQSFTFAAGGLGQPEVSSPFTVNFPEPLIVGTGEQVVATVSVTLDCYRAFYYTYTVSHDHVQVQIFGSNGSEAKGFDSDWTGVNVTISVITQVCNS